MFYSSFTKYTVFFPVNKYNASGFCLFKPTFHIWNLERCFSSSVPDQMPPPSILSSLDFINQLPFLVSFFAMDALLVLLQLHLYVVLILFLIAKLSCLWTNYLRLPFNVYLKFIFICKEMVLSKYYPFAFTEYGVAAFLSNITFLVSICLK